MEENTTPRALRSVEVLHQHRVTLEDKGYLTSINSEPDQPAQNNKNEKSISIQSSKAIQGLSQIPSNYLGSETKKPSVFAASSFHGENHTKPSNAFNSPHINLSMSSILHSIDKRQGDLGDDVLSDEADDISEHSNDVSVPASIASRQNSVEIKQRYSLSIPNQSQEFDTNPSPPIIKLQTMSPIIEIDSSKPREGLFTKGLTQLKKSITMKKDRDSLKAAKNKKQHSVSQDHTPSKSIFSKQGSSRKNLMVNIPNDTIAQYEAQNPDQKTYREDIDLDSQNKLASLQPIETRILSEERMLLSNREELFKTFSDHSDALKVIHKSTLNMNEYSKNIIKTQDSQSPQSGPIKSLSIPPSNRKFKNHFKTVLKSTAFCLLVGLTLAIQTILSTAITYPFESLKMRLWIGELFHGIFLSSIALILINVVINSAIKKALEKEESNQTQREKKIHSRYLGWSFFALVVVLFLFSGLWMILCTRFIFENVNSNARFFASEFLTIIFNSIIICCYFIRKNDNMKAKVKQTQRQGFFFYPIYKDFLSDIQSTKAILDKKPDLSVLTTPKILAGDEIIVKEEGIDKYRPVNSFQVVTSSKILGSQLVLLILYVQFISTIYLAKLYDFVLDKDQIGGAVPIILLYPFLMDIFAKSLDTMNEKMQLSLSAYIHFINAAYTAIFYRTTLFHVQHMKYIWLMIGCKAFYKVLLYLILQIKIHPSLRFNSQKKAQKKKQEALKSTAQVRKSLRSDTLALKFNEEIEKQLEATRKKKEKVLERFVLKFFIKAFNDIFYGIISLGVLLSYEIVRKDPTSSLFKTQTLQFYVKGTWLELAFDIGFTITMGMIWLFIQKFNLLSIVQTISKFLQKFTINLIIISLGLFISFLFLLQSLEFIYVV